MALSWKMLLLGAARFFKNDWSPRPRRSLLSKSHARVSSAPSERERERERERMERRKKERNARFVTQDVMLIRATHRAQLARN